MLVNVQQLIDKFKYALKEKWGYIYGTWGQKVWTQALQNQKINYMVTNYGADWKTDSKAKNDKYYYSAKDGGKWIGHYVADCSGLFRWALNEFGVKISHNSDTIWKSYCSKKGELSGGKRTDSEPLKEGTAVFVHKSGGNRSHIGLYIGDGTVIEASGTNAGVITSKVTDKKWVEWGELKDVDYGAAPAPVEEDGGEIDTGFPTNPVWHPTIRKGSKGDIVKECQKFLDKLGYDLGICGIDGDYGVATERAIKAFQKDHGLVVDGICGPMTWDALQAENDELSKIDSKKTYSITISGLTYLQVTTMQKAYPNVVIKEEIEGV